MAAVHWPLGATEPTTRDPRVANSHARQPGVGDLLFPPPPPPEQEGEEGEGHLNRGRAGSQGCRVDADGRGPAQHRSKEVG